MSAAFEPGTINDGLTIRAIGPATEQGRMSLSELARIASSFQATLERLAFSIIGGRQRTGRRPQEIADAVRMDFTGFRSGSAVLDLERPQNAALDDLLNESFNALQFGLHALVDNPEVVPPHFTPTVINGLVTLCGGISRRNITRIEFGHGERVYFAIDADTQRTLKSVQKSTSQQEINVVGRLHMGDFDPLGLRCRIDTHAGSISCDFDDDLKESVINLLDALVLAAGVAELQADGTTVRVLHLTELSPVETAATKSLDQLAREQNIAPISDVSQLRGEDIEDFDTFLEIVKSAR